MTEVIDTKKITCSPGKKKEFDTECIIMGEELTDLEINFALLLKEQFYHINGLQSCNAATRKTCEEDLE